MSLEVIHVEENYTIQNEVCWETVKVSAYPKAMRTEINGKTIQFHSFITKTLVDQTLEFMRDFKLQKFEGKIYVMRKR